MIIDEIVLSAYRCMFDLNFSLMSFMMRGNNTGLRTES